MPSATSGRDSECSVLCGLQSRRRRNRLGVLLLCPGRVSGQQPDHPQLRPALAGFPGFQEDGGNWPTSINTQRDRRSQCVGGYLTSQNITASNAAFQQSFNACPSGASPEQLSMASRAPRILPPARMDCAERAQHLLRQRPTRFAIAYRPSTTPRLWCRRLRRLHDDYLGPLSFNNSGNPTPASSTTWNHLSRNVDDRHRHRTMPNGCGRGSLDQGVDSTLSRPQSNQWNVTVERQITNSTLLRASYVGMAYLPPQHYEDLTRFPPARFLHTGAPRGYLSTSAPLPDWFSLLSP